MASAQGPSPFSELFFGRLLSILYISYIVMPKTALSIQGHNCEIEVDECLSDPCHNGATCVDHLNAFSCICQDGFEGKTCEANINECHSSPCLHNASCADLIGGYECICLPGFTGARCETDIDECASFPCKNGATCIDRPGNYFCQCVAPFKVDEGKVVDVFYLDLSKAFDTVSCGFL
ncbi:hypothetical protein WISP_01844 [Willisornis vidua]|uniref:EGF-like domain-containing protein n=1 Tax=Willisornis vidua TaxID=1566151 RepID=A0ABQ9DUX2_9PASS|nr:hypothetical protein WISP_111433 [Willisornis vidua]KAJ7428095.1 hypothetical protein WISP_01912 [Willisornis vidua]KAJ7428124.1 hypothetical protein WISP_01844 [Willisornis vidua]